MISKYFLFSLVAAFLLFGCINILSECITGSGSVTTESRSVEAYDSIELGTAASVEVTQGPQSSIHIVAEDNLMDYIETKVENGVLKIYELNNTCLRSTKPVRITLSTEKIEKLTVLGSGKITSSNTIKSDSIDLAVVGSGVMDVGVESNKTKIEIPGSGELRLGGNTSSMDVSIFGSGHLKAYDFATENAKVKITGSGSVELNVSEKLDVDILGSGNVYYKGNATLNQSALGSGKVKKMN